MATLVIDAALDEDTGVMHLGGLVGVDAPHLLWFELLRFAAKHTADGDLSPYPAEVLARAARFAGSAGAFVAALVTAELLTQDMQIRSWAKWQGTPTAAPAPTPKTAAERSKAYRDRHAASRTNVTNRHGAVTKRDDLRDASRDGRSSSAEFVTKEEDERDEPSRSVTKQRYGSVTRDVTQTRAHRLPRRGRGVVGLVEQEHTPATPAAMLAAHPEWVERYGCTELDVQKVWPYFQSTLASSGPAVAIPKLAVMLRDDAAARNERRAKGGADIDLLLGDV